MRFRLGLGLRGLTPWHHWSKTDSPLRALSTLGSLVSVRVRVRVKDRVGVRVRVRVGIRVRVRVGVRVRVRVKVRVRVRVCVKVRG